MEASYQKPLFRSCAAAVVLSSLIWAVLIYLDKTMVFRLTFDDSFYYFEIARNILSGREVSFDGMNLTNGFHPLWMFICVGLYSVLPLTLLSSVQAVLLFQVLLVAVAFLLLLAGLGRVIRQESAGNSRASTSFALAAFCIFLLLLNPFVTKAFVNGLESALSLIVLGVLVLLHSVPARKRSLVQDLSISVGLACLFLARTDAALLFPLYVLWLWTSFPFTEFVTRTFRILLFPSVVVLSYLYWNLAVFGHPLQVSGVVKRMPFSIQGGLLFGSILLGFIVLGWRFGRQTQFALLRDFARQQLWFFMLAGATAGYAIGLQAFPRLWHFTALLFLGFSLFIVFTCNVLSLASQREGSASEVKKMGAILGVPLLLALVVHWQEFLREDLLSIRLANYEAAVWIDQNLDEDDVLASWDAGIIGYFARQSVVNLDGVVNSFEFHQAKRRGDLPQFLNRLNVHWIVNHDLATAEASGEFIKSASRYFGEDRAQAMKLHKRWPFTFSGSTNKEPSGAKSYAVFLYKIPEEGEL